MSKEILDKFSSDELLNLYKEKQAQEEENRIKANKEKIEQLQEERKQVTADYKKQIAEIDKQIKVLGGKAGSVKKTRTAKGSVSEKILVLLKKQGPMSAKDIKTALEATGNDVKYIHQKLAHLKRTEKVSTPTRGLYQAG